MNVFDSMMASYSIQSDADYQNALHEVMQKIALAGLHRGNFLHMLHFMAERVFISFTISLDFQKIWTFP